MLQRLWWPGLREYPSEIAFSAAVCQDVLGGSIEGLRMPK